MYFQMKLKNYQGYLAGGELPPKNSKFPPTLKKAKFLGESISPQIRFVINISDQFDFFLILHDSYCNCLLCSLNQKLYLIAHQMLPQNKIGQGEFPPK